MEFYEREFLVARIIAGYLRYKIKSGLVVQIYPPDKHVNYVAQEVYKEALDEAYNSHLMSDDDVVEYLINTGQWTDEDQKNLDNVLPKHIEYWKVELYNAAFQSTKRNTLRKYLRKAEEELQRLNRVRHQYDHWTAHGVATYARWLFIIENSTKMPDGSLYNWENDDPIFALHYYNDNVISDSDLREIARNEPWASIWSASKKTGKLFDGVITQEQQRLILWASLYDNISESPDCPPDNVIEDDDMLDGWLILQRRKRENEQAKREGEDKLGNERIKNADEVFLPAESLDDMRRIEQMNTGQARAIKSSRISMVQKHGVMRQQDFADIKQKLAIEQTQALMQAVRNKGR